MSRRDTPLSRRLRGVAEGVRRRGERFAAALSHTFSRENMAALFSARSFKEGGISAMSCVLVLGIAAGAVALVETLPSTYTAIDISRDQTTSISDDTAEYLSGLDCDVEVYLIAEEGSEDEYVERMLDQYAQASDRVTVEQVDPALHPTFTDQYTSEDVADGSIIVVVDDASRVASSSDLYTLNYSTFSYEFAGESAITSSIIALTSEDLPVVYVHHRRIPLLPAAGNQFVRNHLRPLGRQRLRALSTRPRHHRDRLVQKHARHPEPAGDLEQRLREDRYRELRHPGAGRRRRRRADGGRHGRLRGGGDDQTHVVWYSTEQFLADEIDYQVGGYNTTLFIDSLSWLAGAEDISTGLSSKGYGMSLITVDDASAGMLSAVFVGIVPGIALVAGLMIWRSRKAR